jgi:hypothetical protein
MAARRQAEGFLLALGIAVPVHSRAYGTLYIAALVGRRRRGRLGAQRRGGMHRPLALLAHAGSGGTTGAARTAGTDDRLAGTDGAAVDRLAGDGRRWRLAGHRRPGRGLSGGRLRLSLLETGDQVRARRHDRPRGGLTGKNRFRGGSWRRRGRARRAWGGMGLRWRGRWHRSGGSRSSGPRGRR